MRQFNVTFLLATIASVGVAAQAQEYRRAYDAFDAIADGTQSSEARRLSLINAQLDTMSRVPVTVVAGPRAIVRDPSVAAVYPYGRRGIFGLRPRGYIVVRRAPLVVYRRSYAVEPPSYELGFGSTDYFTWPSVRQPIGHESLQTGPDRWEYRPLYAEDDRQFDEMHREIERDLRSSDGYGIEPRGYASDEPARREAARALGQPEELPQPTAAARVLRDNGSTALPGQARDIARDTAPRNDAASSTARRRPPPPPQADPPDQPRSTSRGPSSPSSKQVDDAAPAPHKATADKKNVEGPLLQNPATGAREF